MYKQMKYHYFYKITNLINGHYYYGVHSTNNLEDNYMGSGVKLHKAFKIYGKENFKKEILKFFDTKEEAYLYELKIVDENLVRSKECYNICPGGLGSFNNNLILVHDKLNNTSKFVTKQEFDNNVNYESYNKNYVVVKDKNENIYRVNKNDEKYLNGELVHISTGTTVAIVNGINKRISIEEYKENKYKNITTEKVQCIDENGNHKLISQDEFKTGKYTSIHKGKLTVIDENGNYKNVNINDKDYKSGKYKFMFKGTKNFVNIKTGEVKRLKLDDEILSSGEWIGQNAGKMIYKDKNGKCYKCEKTDPRVLSGKLVPNQTGNKHSEETKKKIGQYGKGRIWVNNGKENKFIKPEEFDKLEGYVKGKLIKKKPV